MGADITVDPKPGTTDQPDNADRAAEPPPAFTHHPGAARWALLWVLPYLLFGLVWAFTNPPGSAPDETDHLIKSIGAGRLEIGQTFTGSLGDDLVSQRSASTARTLNIPAKLAPDGLLCSAFQPDVTAACLPTAPVGGDELVERTTATGAYPVFVYIPMGVAMLFADSTQEAIHLGRLVSLLMSVGLLFLGVWHLTRWLGRGAAVGLAVAVTPMAVFAASSVSTSGVEIFAGAAVGTVVVVSTRRAASLADPGTLLVLTISASALVLSRQLGAVALLVLAVVALLRGGARVVWDQLRHGSRPMIATVVIVGLSCLALVIWELRYDHPALTGPVLSAGAFGTYIDQSFGYVSKGIGWFGWLDTPLPGPAIALWVFVAVTMIGGAILVGRAADRWTLIGLFVVIAAVAYVTHATVFYPVHAGLQGRHMLPIFMILPTLGGVVLVEYLQSSPRPRAARRLAVLVAFTMAGLQLFSLLLNARRYAVGADGPIWFLPTAQWAPRFGYWPWFVVAAIAAIWLAIMIVGGGRRPVVLPADGRLPGAGSGGTDRPVAAGAATDDR